MVENGTFHGTYVFRFGDENHSFMIIYLRIWLDPYLEGVLPISKWLTIMVKKSPCSRVFPLQNDLVSVK